MVRECLVRQMVLYTKYRNLRMAAGLPFTNPTATEILKYQSSFRLRWMTLRPLDEEERSRIEVEDTYTLILVDVPMIEERNDKDWYGTIPLGIIVTDKMIFTVCLEDTQVLTNLWKVA